MAYFHTNVLDNQIKALPTVSTASGSVATFDTDMTENLIEVVCDIQYSQASGTPSPSDPLPITTYTSLNLSHSGADTSNPNVTNIPFGQTVAKGTLNVTTGVLTILWGVLDLGSVNWQRTSSSGIYYFYRTMDNMIEIVDSSSSDRLKFASEIYAKPSTLTSSVGATLSTDNTAVILFGSSAGRIAIRNDTYTDVTAFKNGMGGVYMYYELETSLTVQLDSKTIMALLNENNIWCDTNGNTSVKYILSVGKAIS